MVVDTSDSNELKFRNPERLLVIVIAFIFWGVGFIDLIGHSSAEPDILGSYSLPFFIFLLLYASTAVIWIVLFVSPKALARVVDLIERLQARTWRAVGVLLALALAFWIILEWERWSRLPGLQLAALALTSLATIVFVFYGWNRHARDQRWRKFVAYPLLALVAVEVVVQALAFFGVLPGSHRIGGHYVPYERIYQNDEGFRNGVANRYGWYFPDFEFDDDNRRILLLGGADVQGLQVLPEEQISTRLAETINQNLAAAEVQTEVVSVGLPGFGPSPYLYEDFLAEFKLRSDEIILFFHLGDDYQRSSEPADPITYVSGDDGGARVRPSDARLRHDLTHYFLRGFLSFHIVETIRSHYLTPKVLGGLVGSWSSDGQPVSASGSDGSGVDIPRMQGRVTGKFPVAERGHASIRTTELATIPGGSNFLFERDGTPDREESHVAARSIIETAHDFAETNGIAFRVVTIPVFPTAFFDRFQGGNWEPEIDDYDLFLPERALIDIARANDIPILPMGQYMYDNKLGVEEIRQLYYADGFGQLTSTGHEYFADAVLACFYSDSGDACPE